MKMELRVGAQFDNFPQLRNAIKNEAIQCHVELKVEKADKYRYTVSCADKTCPWRLHSSVINGGPRCEIKKFDGLHTCGNVAKLFNKEVSSSFLAGKYMGQIRDQSDYKPAQMQEDFKRETGKEISYKVAYSAIKIALGLVHCEYSEAYRKIEAYCEGIQLANPGTVALLQQTTNGRFYRLFLAFGPSIKGWKSCRPVIGLDGFSLTGKHRGNLLCATGIDANGELYPIAFGVIDNENEENWVWFLQHLHDTFQVSWSTTFVSDRRKELLAAMDLVFQGFEHAFCINHLDANLKKKCSDGEFIRFFWKAASAKSVEEFNEAIECMRAIDADATEWILTFSPPQHWATAHFEGKRFGHLVSNIGDALNSWLLEARDKPITSVLEIIRMQLTDRFCKNHNDGEISWASLGEDADYTLVNEAQQHIQRVTEMSRIYKVFQCDEVVFEVQGPEYCYMVNAEQRTCSCLEWQTLGLPCAHAAALSLFKNQHVELYAHEGYLLSSFRSTYEGEIYPAIVKNVEVIGILPPAMYRRPGRPKRKCDDRTTENIDKEKRMYKCKRCGNAGHNERTCKNPIG